MGGGGKKAVILITDPNPAREESSPDPESVQKRKCV